MLELVPLATLRITISGQTLVRGIPAGARLIGEAATCELTGRLTASQAGTSSDWLILHADGSLSVDARLLLATPAGATLTIRYTGRAAALPITGGAVYIAAAFETDDPEFGWANTIQAVGKGVRDGMTLTYELYELS